MTVDTIPARLFQRARLAPSAPAYHVRSAGSWHATSYAEYADQVKRAGKALIALGFEPGQKVSILGFNRPEWVILDVACMAVGGAPAGIYTTCSPEEVRYIVDHSESPVALVENEAQWRKIEAERANLPKLRHVVTMRGTKAIDDPLVLSFDAFLAKGDGVSDEEFFARLDALEPGGLATLIYTSGTTGPPKGVMLSHYNLTWTADLSLEIASLTANDRIVSYLPLSHIAEQIWSIHGPITCGASIYFAESLDKLADNLKEVQPTLFFGVPRIWEKFHAGVSAKLRDAKGAKAKLAEWAMGVGKKVNALRAEGEKPSALLAAQYRLADKLFFSKVKSALGFGSARLCVSGAAPIAKEIIEFFAGLDLLVLEVYGQSEDTGPTTFNLPNRFKFGTVGTRLRGIEVKIAEDGEILVRGPHIFLGYYKDPAATAETIVNGWLHSGDLGEFDEDDFLRITGRKKDIIITAGGKNIAPKNIEHAIKNQHPIISEVVVVGDRRKFLTALITLDPESAAKWATENGVDKSQVHHDPKLLAELQAAIDEANRQFARVEQVKRFRVLRRNLTIENGELTPTLKVKRNVVQKNFAPEIESMYAE